MPYYIEVSHFLPDLSTKRRSGPTLAGIAAATQLRKLVLIQLSLQRPQLSFQHRSFGGTKPRILQPILNVGHLLQPDSGPAGCPEQDIHPVFLRVVLKSQAECQWNFLEPAAKLIHSSYACLQVIPAAVVGEDRASAKTIHLFSPSLTYLRNLPFLTKNSPCGEFSDVRCKLVYAATPTSKRPAKRSPVMTRSSW